VLLLISTYQAGQLVAVGVADKQLTFSFRRFDRAMGVAVGADRIAVAGERQIWELPDHSELAPAIAPAGRYDRCWLPRTSTVTGPIQSHEIAWGATDHGEPDLWIVNTLFSCLAGLDPHYRLRAALRPPFISRGGRTRPLSLERLGDARRIPSLRDRDGTHRFAERVAQDAPTTAAPCSTWSRVRR
jgi:uncharacterized protein (TIGR03032 family)